MATFESGGFSMALKKIATDSTQPAYYPITHLGRTQRGQSNNEIKFLFSILNTTPEG